jgi:hypothetical protein
MEELRFVTYRPSGQVGDIPEARAVRCHIRRVVLRNRSRADLAKRIKQYSVVRFSKLIDGLYLPAVAMAT